MPPEKIDSLADDVKPRGLLRQISVLTARVDELVAQNKALLARIAELEAERGKPPKTPDNSSLPPSRGQKGNVAEPTRVAPAFGQAVAPTVAPANSGKESAASVPDFSGMWVHGSIPGFEPLPSGPTSLVNRSRRSVAQLLQDLVVDWPGPGEPHRKT
jgi:hypothetical protein